MEDVKKYILNFVKNKLHLSVRDENKLLATDYLGESLLDSFQFMEMISDFEKKFRIRFTSKDLSSGSIRTLGGIESVINKLIKSRKNEKSK